jgi:hypothetical protein
LVVALYNLVVAVAIRLRWLHIGPAVLMFQVLFLFLFRAVEVLAELVETALLEAAAVAEVAAM